MKTLNITVETVDDVKRRISAAVKSGRADLNRYTFKSIDDFSRTLTPTRWAIINAMAGAGTMSFRELARRVERDVKGVHTDAQALLNVGLIEKTGDGIAFPYDAVHVDFKLRAA